MKKQFKAFGIMRLNYDVYAVLDTNHIPDHVLSIVGQITLPTFYIARCFLVEKKTPDLVSLERVYVTPHWLTPSCPYMIEWFDTPKEIEVLIGGDNENG